MKQIADLMPYGTRILAQLYHALMNRGISPVKLEPEMRGGTITFAYNTTVLHTFDISLDCRAELPEGDVAGRVTAGLHTTFADLPGDFGSRIVVGFNVETDQWFGLYTPDRDRPTAEAARLAADLKLTADTPRLIPEADAQELVGMICTYYLKVLWPRG